MQARLQGLEAQLKQVQSEKGTADQEFMQVMEQTEVDFEDTADRLKDSLQNESKLAREEIEDLNAQVHLYMRCLSRAPYHQFHIAQSVMSVMDHDVMASTLRFGRLPAQLPRRLHPFCTLICPLMVTQGQLSTQGGEAERHTRSYQEAEGAQRLGQPAAVQSAEGKRPAAEAGRAERCF
jgi:hypothetical protein